MVATFLPQRFSFRTDMHKRFVVRVIHPCAGVTDAPSDPHPLLNQHAWTTTFRQYFDRAVDKY